MGENLNVMENIVLDVKIKNLKFSLRILSSLTEIFMAQTEDTSLKSSQKKRLKQNGDVKRGLALKVYQDGLRWSMNRLNKNMHRIL